MTVNRYQKVQENAEDPRSAEYRMLARVTGMLISGAEKGGRELIEACYYNRKLWTIFQADLAQPGNALPDEVKARLISLSFFVQRHTDKISAGASVQPLIDINKSIMEGLMPSAAARATATQAQPAFTAAATA
jgi:flagellar protein FlaF